jgi:hypothetical protein
MQPLWFRSIVFALLMHLVKRLIIQWVIERLAACAILRKACALKGMANEDFDGSHLA